MERSFGRELEGYTEKHHIVPKCMGGDNKLRNIAILTPEEHYIAHQLLVKIYPENKKLIYALNMMSDRNPLIRRVKSKRYGWIRRKVSEARMGYSHSEETKRKISDSHKGKKLSDEHIAAMIASKTGSKMSPKSKENISLGIMKRTRRAWNHGCKGWRNGIKHTEESKEKLRKSATGKITKTLLVYQFDMLGNKVARYNSVREATKITGIHRKTFTTIKDKGLLEYKNYLWFFVYKHQILNK